MCLWAPIIDGGVIVDSVFIGNKLNWVKRDEVWYLLDADDNEWATAVPYHGGWKVLCKFEGCTRYLGTARCEELPKVQGLVEEALKKHYFTSTAPKTIHRLTMLIDPEGRCRLPRNQAFLPVED
jgi:hypothetical protein